MLRMCRADQDLNSLPLSEPRDVAAGDSEQASASSGKFYRSGEIS